MSGDDVAMVGFTVAAAAGAVVLMAGPGLGLAWLLARRQWPGKSLVEALVTLPLALPPVATGLVLLWLLGRGGPLGRWLADGGWVIVFTWKAVVISLAVMAFPLFVRSARTAIEGVPLRLEGVARTLGAGPWRIFWRVTLPLARRGVTAGALLAFARALGEFGATMVVAGYVPGATATLPLEIYQALNLGHVARAWSLAGVSAALALGAVWAAEAMKEKGGQ